MFLPLVNSFILAAIVCTLVPSRGMYRMPPSSEIGFAAGCALRFAISVVEEPTRSHQQTDGYNAKSYWRLNTYIFKSWQASKIQR